MITQRQMNTYILVALTAIIGVIIFICVKTYLQIQSEFNLIHKQLSYLNSTIEQIRVYSNNTDKVFSCPQGEYTQYNIEKHISENKLDEYKNNNNVEVEVDTCNYSNPEDRNNIDEMNESNDICKDNNISDKCVNSVEGVMVGGISEENTVVEEPISDDIIDLINKYKDDKEFRQENALSEMSNLADCENSENQELNSLLMNLINTSGSVNKQEEQILEDNKLDNPLTETKSELETDILQTRYKLPELRDMCKTNGLSHKGSKTELTRRLIDNGILSVGDTSVSNKAKSISGGGIALELYLSSDVQPVEEVQ